MAAAIAAASVNVGSAFEAFTGPPFGARRGRDLAKQEAFAFRRATVQQRGNTARMEPLVITVAAVGAELMPEQTPHLPVTPAQLGETAALCRAAGAAMIHVHCRSDDGRNTSDVERFRQAQAAIREASDLIVQFTTGGAIGMTAAERAAPLQLRPEMATLTCGTVNFGDDVFENSFPIMRGILAEMQRFGVRPELEIFDAGHVSNAKRLAAEGVLTFPQHVDFVLGVPGGLDAAVRNLVYLVDSLPPGCTWSVAGIGRDQLPLATVAAAMGGHVRVGLEDNIYYSKGRLARNDELVARVARIAAELGRPVATPAEARRILGLAAPVSAA
jgi:3-keto-5-aminohexanoate cleavage enzyme